MANYRLRRNINSRQEAQSLSRRLASWEKTFYTKVCRIRWKTVLERQNHESMRFCYKNVMEWDDSAAEEAFLTAKTHYWAQLMSRARCELPLPDPDLYTQNIVWDAEDDEEAMMLLDDMEDDYEEFYLKVEKTLAEKEAHLRSLPVVATGWDDNSYDGEYVKPKIPVIVGEGTKENPWRGDDVKVPTRWGTDDENFHQVTMVNKPSSSKAVFRDSKMKNHGKNINAWKTLKSRTYWSGNHKMGSNVWYGSNQRKAGGGTWVWRKKQTAQADA